MQEYLVLTKYQALEKWSDTKIVKTTYAFTHDVLSEKYPSFMKDFDDIKQEAAYAVWKAMERYSPYGPIEQYILKIVSVVIKEETKKITTYTNGRVLFSETGVYHEVEQIESDIEEAETHNELWDFIKCLSDIDQRRCLLKMKGLTNAQIIKAENPKIKSHQIGNMMIKYWAEIRVKYEKFLRKGGNDMDNPINLDKIKGLMREHKMTYADFATAFNISKSSAQNYLTGKQMMKVDLLYKIADYFKVAIDTLFR